MVSLEKLVNPTERQREFLAATANFDFVLYGGEAGGGKSYILRWWLVLYLLWTFKVLGLRGVRVGLFCETYRTLADRQVCQIRAEFPRWLGELSKGDEGLNFTLRKEHGSGVIALRNLDDPEKYKSAQFAAIAVDELTLNPLSVFNLLRFRLRWPGIERPKFGAGTNPGGVGHPWVKKYWVTKEYPPELERKRDQFVLVKAKASDNPYVDPNYHDSLLTLPPELAKQVAHGDWDVYTGQYFPHFNPKIHVISRVEAVARIQPWHSRSLSGDWGDEHPHCFHWHSKDERNCIITYRELWGRRTTETDVGRQLTEMEAQDFKLSPLKGFVFSWDAGRLSPNALREEPKSILQILSDALGPKIPRPFPADSSPGVRLIRARLMSQVLFARTWLISEDCPKLIESIPAMIHDLKKPEEMLKVDWNEATIGDDPVDSAGMGLQWMIGSTVKPDSVKLEEQIQAVRQQFAARAEPEKPGEDWFTKFGGEPAKNKR